MTSSSEIGLLDMNILDASFNHSVFSKKQGAVAEG